MNTRCKGRAAELKIELRAVEKGVILSRPTTDARYDYIVDSGDKLLRAQVKYAAGKVWHSTGAVRVDLRRFSGSPVKNTRTYTRDEIDLLLVYVPDIDRVLAFGPDVFERKTSLHIRLTASSNKQKKLILDASNFIW